jgi:hypothetical protein
MCDRAAERMAALIRADYKFVNRDVPRSVMDMNRPVARETAFRRAIAATPARVLIDVHSFPCCVFGDAHFAIMEPAPTPEVKRLIDEYLRPMTGMVGMWMPGDAVVNSIVADARERGVQVSFLLEVREDLTPTAIATAINTWTESLPAHK